jgi:hypothetical protein
MVVINWMKREYRTQNLLLSLIFKEINNIQFGFYSISFSHVFRELNFAIDALFKDGLQLEYGVCTMMEPKDQKIQEITLPFMGLSTLSPSYFHLFFFVYNSYVDL